MLQRTFNWSHNYDDDQHNQSTVQKNLSLSKIAANSGPVFITNRGEPAHVLLSFELYQQIIKQKRNIVDALAMPGAPGIEFEPGQARLFSQAADLS